MSADAIEQLRERVRADERQLAEIEGKSRYSNWAKELRQRIRGTRAQLRALEEDEA